MRKNVFGFLALMAVFLFSCSNNDFEEGIKRDGMVDFTIKTSIPQGIKTYASDNGRATNVNTAQFNLRYIMEVWTKDKKLAFRDYRIVNDNFTTTSVTFAVRLLAQKYDFVFWADFVDIAVTDSLTAASGDMFYTTNTNDGSFPPISTDLGLQEITMKAPYSGISDDARDAFFAVEEIDLSTSGVLRNDIILKRPFGKYRLIATDVPQNFNLATDYAGNVEINYSAMSPAVLPSGFNALDSTLITGKTISVASYIAQAEKTTYNNKDAYLLAFDYIFAPKTVLSTVKFNATVYNKTTGTQIGYREIPDIPIERNKLTTVVGNFFSNTAVMEIIVEDEFDSPDIDISMNFEDNQIVPVNNDLQQKFIIPDNTVTPTYTFTIVGKIPAGVELAFVDETPGDADKNYKGTVIFDFSQADLSEVDATNYLYIDVPGATVPWPVVVWNGEIVIGTAPFTFILPAGATVNGLTIAQGNAKINGTVNTLRGVAAGSIVEVYGTVNAFTGVNNGTIEIYKAPGDVGSFSSFSGTGKVFWGVATATDFRNAIDNADPYNAATKRNDGVILMNNITGFVGSPSGPSGVLPIGKNNYTIDGRNFSLSGTAQSGATTKGVLVLSGRSGITIKDITVTSTATGANGHAAIFMNPAGGGTNYVHNVTLTGRNGLGFSNGSGTSTGKIVATGKFYCTGTASYGGIDTGTNNGNVFDFFTISRDDTDLIKMTGIMSTNTHRLIIGSGSTVTTPSWW